MIYFILALMVQARAATFADRDLFQTLRRFCSGKDKCIFLVWSPHMRLSVKGLNLLNRYARRERIRVIPLLDPNADKQFAERVRQREKWPAEATRRLASGTLIKRGARVHYPNYSFAHRGKLGDTLVPGMRTQNDLKRLSRLYF